MRFIDANVVFAAAISAEGRSAALFLLSQRRVYTLLSSTHALAETRRNLEARYPGALGRFERLTNKVTIVPEASSLRVASARHQRLPDEDAPILAAAAEASADVLVTGDQSHFGHLFGRTLQGVRVLTLADTLDLLARRKGWM